MVSFKYQDSIPQTMDKKHHNDIEYASEVVQVVEADQRKKPTISVGGPASRGVPSKESMWLDDIKRLRGDWAYHKNVRLELNQILELVFPPKYQRKYHLIAIEFMNKLFANHVMRGDDIGAFIREKDFSKATFYNVVLPRLRRVGMVRLEREEFHHEHSKQKFYKKIVRPSTQFSKFWTHIASEYDSLVQTAKARGSD
jgi:hypothetical protein